MSLPLRSAARSLALLGAIAAAFGLGLLCAPEGGAAAAQGRGVRPPPKDEKKDPPPPTSAPLVWGGEGGSAGAANGFIAVTGSYAVGTSVLYVLDTNTKQLAVYEARGGSPGGRKLYLVGARRIDLDLQLQGYNDESQYDYATLRRMFDDNEKKIEAAAPGTGTEPTAPAAPRK
jgi:hypothetical protein